ncbi:MAG TPA: mechanosensitive ion channel family protein [Planctomycetaceae bacterium]|nr:mechanosensitive ion channel family protein [Planctomycetaceae bacterium]
MFVQGVLPRSLLFTCLLLFQTTVFGQVQEALPVNGAVVPPVESAVVPAIELRSPRASLTTFLNAMQEKNTELAVTCLDLGNLTQDVVRTSGPGLAYKLHVAIQKLTRITIDQTALLSEVPDENNDLQPFSLGALSGSQPEAAALVIRFDPADASWRFSNETCEALEDIYSQFENAPDAADQETLDESHLEQPFPIRLRNWFPLTLRHKTLLLPNYQWICLLALIFIGLIADVLTRGILTALSTRWLDSDVSKEERAMRANVWRPLGRLVNATTWYWGTKLIGLPPATLSIMLVVLKVFTIFAAAWTGFAVIDVATRYLARQAMRTGTKFDDLLVPLVSKSLKILVVCIAVLTAAQTFDIPIMGLVGGLGLGGAALAFAAKDAVANFFGSVTVLFDRPFEVGDWIVTNVAEGTVETVGFRSTRIRTFYNSLVTLPNSHLTTAAVDNMGRRRYRRIKTTLGVQYDTSSDQLEAFCEGVRELIRRHPDTRKDYFHVYFNDFGASSLNIMLYCFLHCPDWGTELSGRHKLLADIVRLADKLNVKFAFPTRTLHMASPDDQNLAPEFDQPLQAGKEVAVEITKKQ